MAAMNLAMCAASSCFLMCTRHPWVTDQRLSGWSGRTARNVTAQKAAENKLRLASLVLERRARP